MHNIISIGGSDRRSRGGEGSNRGGGGGRGSGGSNRAGGGSTSGDGDENTLEDSGSPGSNRVQLDRGQNSGQNRGQNKKRVDDAVGGNDEGKKKTGDCFVTFCYKL